MATTGTLLEAMVSYYGNLSRQALGAMYQTREELRTDSFNWNKALGRTISVWMDAAEGWWSAFLVTANAPLPTIFLDIGADDTTAVRSVNVAVPEGVDPTVSVVGELGGTRKFPRESVQITATTGRDAIEVNVKNLAQLRTNNTVGTGLYGGIIHVKEKPLAFLIIRMD
jgi:hypothetical protein